MAGSSGFNESGGSEQAGEVEAVVEDGLRIGPWLPEPRLGPATATQRALTASGAKHRYRPGGRHNPLTDDYDEYEDGDYDLDERASRTPPVAAAHRLPLRWPDRPLLALIGVAIGVAVAVGGALVLVPSPEPLVPDAAPPPAVLPVTPDAPRTPVTTPPSAQPEPSSPIGGAHTASSRPSKPLPPPPPPRRSTRPPLPELRAASPHRARYLRSIESDRSTSIQFVNRRSERVLICWLDFSGRPVLYRVLGPGESYRQRTFVTHPWLVTNAFGWPLAVFQPISEPARATIR